MALFYMQYKGREKAAKVVEFVAKWLNLCLSTVRNYSKLMQYTYGTKKIELVQNIDNTFD